MKVALTTTTICTDRRVFRSDQFPGRPSLTLIQLTSFPSGDLFSTLGNPTSWLLLRLLYDAHPRQCHHSLQKVEALRYSTFTPYRFLAVVTDVIVN